MKHTAYSLSILLAFVVLASTGCRTTSLSLYHPSDPPIYTTAWNQTADIRPVHDRRSDYEPNVYYRHYRDRAKFDRPIAAIVHHVLTTELARAGLRTSHKSPDVVLECEVHDFRAVITETEFEPTALDLSLEVRFRWVNPETQAVLEENVRRLRRHRVLGSAEAVALPFDADQVRDFGQELLNEMLPRVIEKELNPSLAYKLPPRAN